MSLLPPTFLAKGVNCLKDFFLKGQPRRKFQRLRFLWVKSLWNSEGITEQELVEMTLLCQTLLMNSDPSFQRVYFLVLYELKRYIQRIEVGIQQLGRASLIICRWTCSSFLPGSPREAFGILGQPELNQSLLRQRRIVLRRFRPSRRIGVGIGDKGQRENSSTSGLSYWKAVVSFLTKGEVPGLDYRYTEPIIFPDGLPEWTNKVLPS